MDHPRLDRKAFSVTSLHAPSDEPAYWRDKSPAERLRALEYLRQQMYDYDPATTRIQKVLEIVERDKH